MYTLDEVTKLKVRVNTLESMIEAAKYAQSDPHGIVEIRIGHSDLDNWIHMFEDEIIKLNKLISGDH